MAKKDELNFENGNNMAASEKLKALQAAMDKIEKSFGKGSIMKMGDESVEQVEVIPTGSIGLNVALGVGGYPRGRIIEIYEDKAVIQVFEGTVIARKHGGIGETITVRRVSYGVGCEKVFPLHSPNVAMIETVRKGQVRRAKLYYLRGRVGKAAKIAEKI